jgi:hypothetical protein
MTKRRFSKEVTSRRGNDSYRGDELITVRGLIIPVDWDQEGKVVGLALSSYDEQEYRIEMQDKGIELFKCVRKEVEVTGSIDERDGKKIFNVKKYTLEVV